MTTAAEKLSAELVDRFGLKALVESCLVLEEGIATTREIDLGMMAGAGIIPPPFARADQVGLDELLERLERAAVEWGEDVRAAADPSAAGRAGPARGEVGPGLLPLSPVPIAGWDESPVKLETRWPFAIAWLDRPPANSISPEVVEALVGVWDEVTSRPELRALVFASANPMLFCAGADIKAFTAMDETAAATCSTRCTACCARWSARASSRSPRSTRSRSAAAASSRWRATSGSPPSRRASASPRSTSGSSPASAGPSGCRG